MPTIAAVLEDCNGNTIMVKHASLNHALSQTGIVAVERSGPVILAFTSMLVTEIEDSGTLCLLNTAATRIIQGCWSHQFRELKNALVTIGYSPTYEPAYVKHRLPPKATLFKLMASKAPSASQQNHSSIWCLIKIKKIPTYTNHCHSDPETNPFPRFQMNVECEDVSTTSCILFFDNDVASSLLRKSA
ncbi:unnamed protein product [Linum trigynum]|uniref:Uncharacterized protein n=1 Tax=Linum trigynum TaxID=586398 RepID=A0AAV2FWG7_9ROSI